MQAKGMSYDFLVPLPQMIPVKQKFNRDQITEHAKVIREQYEKFPGRKMVKPGARIAIAVGSRGIHAIDVIIKTLVQELQKQGALPFIVPAMGSHGGATAEGQKQVLAEYDITEESMGAPIVSSMETVAIGELSDGTPVVVDKVALNSDGIIPVNRIKPHTGYKAAIESGLLKMLVIGLGKHAGASIIHQFSFGDFPEIIEEAGTLILKRTPVIFGLAVVENSYDKTALLEFVSRDSFVTKEHQLLETAKRNIPRILFPEIDLLIVQEIGKDISGPGMDPNVTGRSASPFFKRELIGAPKVQKIAVLDLTEKTKGNANGVGVADVTTQRLFDKIDFHSTYINAITATVTDTAKVPIIVANDYEAVQVGLKTCRGVNHPNSRIIWIKNTLELEHIYVSETYLSEIEQNESLELRGEPGPWPFRNGKLEIEN